MAASPTTSLVWAFLFCPYRCVREWGGRARSRNRKMCWCLRGSEGNEEYWKIEDGVMLPDGTGYSSHWEYATHTLPEGTKIETRPKFHWSYQVVCGEQGSGGRCENSSSADRVTSGLYVAMIVLILRRSADDVANVLDAVSRTTLLARTWVWSTEASFGYLFKRRMELI